VIIASPQLTPGQACFANARGFRRRRSLPTLERGAAPARVIENTRTFDAIREHPPGTGVQKDPRRVRSRGHVQQTMLRPNIRRVLQFAGATGWSDLGRFTSTTSSKKKRHREIDHHRRVIFWGPLSITELRGFMASTMRSEAQKNVTLRASCGEGA